MVIRSTGQGPDGSATTVDSVYPWVSRYSDVPGGVVTYFAGTITQGIPTTQVTSYSETATGSETSAVCSTATCTFSREP